MCVSLVSFTNTTAENSKWPALIKLGMNTKQDVTTDYTTSDMGASIQYRMAKICMVPHWYFSEVGNILDWRNAAARNVKFMW
jgi:hypothetical protein